MSEDSYVRVDKDGKATAYVGLDGTRLAAAITLANALKGYAKFKIVPTRTVTPTRMLRLAESYSGKKYKRGQYLQAEADVRTWIEAMKAAIPVVREE